MIQTSKRLPALGLSAATLLLPAIAIAQDMGGMDPVPAPVTRSAPADVYEPVPRTPRAEIQSKADEDPASTPATSASLSPRAEGMTFALGINYILGGAQLDRPSGASLRIRLFSGLTFEPFVRLATHGQSTQGGDAKNALNEFIVGTNARLPLKSRGKVDLVAQAGGSLGVIGNDPDGDDNNTTTTTLTIDYGLSLEYWFNQNWTLSFSARNRLLRYQSISQQQSDDLAQTNTDIGIIWDPIVESAVHLYF